MYITKKFLGLAVLFSLFYTQVCFGADPSTAIGDFLRASEHDRATREAVAAQRNRSKFTTQNLSWKSGPTNLTFEQAQEWVKHLGPEWRMPLHQELLSLNQRLGRSHPYIRRNRVWAADGSAVHFMMRRRIPAERAARANRGMMAVAVGPEYLAYQHIPRANQSHSPLFEASGLEWYMGPKDYAQRYSLWIDAIKHAEWRIPTTDELLKLRDFEHPPELRQRFYNLNRVGIWRENESGAERLNYFNLRTGKQLSVSEPFIPSFEGYYFIAVREKR